MNRSKTLTMVVLAGALGACQPDTFDGTAYGEPITLATLTPVAAILDGPERWLGERVLVQGRVTGVCDHMGCWIELVGDRDESRIRVKVDDGVIVFPAEAVGRLARAEGVVEKVERTADEVRAAARHRAEERGLDFDEAAEYGPETIYRIRGLGAVIQVAEA